MRTVFLLHNETINIWTHLLGTLYFVVDMFMFIRGEAQLASLGDIFILFCYAACIICLFASTWFHIHCCQSCPKQWACALRYDQAGIMIVVLTMNLTSICLLFVGRHSALQPAYLVFALLAGVIAALPVTVSRLSQWSYPALTFFCLSSILPVVHFMAIATPAEVRLYVSPMLMFMPSLLIGAVIFFTRVPERHMPGRFDVFLHSHQIWHVLVFLGLQSAMEGIKRVHTLRTPKIYI
jgi:adiponectin receptor